MKITRLIKRLGLRLFPPPDLPSKGIEGLLRALEKTREDEISCDEVLALLDTYAEMMLRGEDAARLMPLVRLHLELCRECCEELQALLQVLQSALPA